MRGAYFPLALALAITQVHAQERIAPDVAALLHALGDGDEAARKAAEDALVGIGPAIAESLENAGATAPAEVRQRLQRLQAAFDWDLPGPVRQRLWRTLVRWESLTGAERIAFLVTSESGLGPFPGGHAHLFAPAWERETNPATRKGLAPRLVEAPGAVHVLARRVLGRTAGAAGVWALRLALAEIAGHDQGERQHEARVALCGVLARCGLADLATPSFAGQLLAPTLSAGRARELAAASEALAGEGLLREALLLGRRGVALALGPVDELRRLEELSARVGQGAAHLALLRWLAAAPLTDAVAAEVTAERRRLEAQADAVPVEPLAAAVRLHGWTLAPQCPFHLLTRTALVLAGARFGRPQSPNVFAWAPTTGELLWAHIPPPESATQIRMADYDRPALFALDDGVLVLHHVDSEYGGSSATYDRGMRRARLTRLGADGSVRWRRNYDPSPAMNFDRLGPNTAWFAAGTDQHLARAWVLRLDDGQVVASWSKTAAITRLDGGHVLLRGARFQGVRRVDPIATGFLWERNLDAHIGRGMDLTTGWLEDELLFAITADHLVRFEADSGWVNWSRDLESGHTAIGVVAAGSEVHVVLQGGNGSWTVVPFTIDDGTRGEAFTGPSGGGPVGARGAIVQPVRVAPGVFALGGRLLDLPRRRILWPQVRAEAGLPALARGGGDQHPQFHLSDDPSPEPYLRFEGWVARVRPQVARSPRADLLGVAEALERLPDPGAADALRATLIDLDPLTPVHWEHSGGK